MLIRRSIVISGESEAIVRRRSAMDQGYGIKCEPEPPFQLDYYRPLSSESEQSPEGTLDMDLTGFLDMDDTALSGKSRRERESTAAI